MDVSLLNNELIYAIVPTVLIPFAVVSVWVSILATFVAGLFGIHLKAEGPKRLLELLLKPKILISALLLNSIGFGGYALYGYVKNLPSFMWTLQRTHNLEKMSSERIYTNHIAHANNHITGSVKTATILGIQQNWATKIPHGAFRGAAISGGSLFYGTDDLRVYEIDQKTGSVLRKFYIGTSASPSPIIWNNQLFVGEGTHDTHHARIYKFNLSSGDLIGTYSTTGHTEGQPSIATYNNTTRMFAVSGSDGVHAVDPETMKRIWHANDGHIDASILVVENKLFAATGREKGNARKYKSYAVSYAFEDGAVRWKRELPASSWMKPVKVDQNICYIMGEIYFETGFGGITCFHIDSGVPTKTFHHLNAIASRPLHVNGAIFTADLYGNVCKTDIRNNKKSWCYDTQSKNKSITPMTYDPNLHVVIFPSREDGIYTFNPDSGELVNHWKPSEKQGTWKKTYAGLNIVGSSWFTIDDKGTIRGLTPIQKM